MPDYPHVNKALHYARAVVSGEINACVYVKQACQRQLSDLERKDWNYTYDKKKAETICEFIETQPHIKGVWAKKKEKLILSAWQIFILTTVFGWVDRKGNRRFRTVYIEVPRKNGKTTFSAPVGLFMLTEDGEQGAEVYSAATNRDQARIVFQDAQNMAKKNARFRDHYGVQVMSHNINRLETASKFEPLSAEGNSLDGLNIHCAIVDELHAHKTRQVFDVIETSMGSRSQPILWIITTAGSNRAGICYEQRAYTVKILERAIEDETYFGIIYTIDEKDDWRDEQSWIKANPNYGVSVYPDDIKRLGDKAMEMASAQNSFLTKRLNIWVNADTAWMPINKWEACGDSDLKIEDFAVDDCYIGLDLSSKIDVSSKVYLFKKDSDYYCFAKHYLPRENVKSESHAKTAHFEGWAKDGWIELTGGNMIDFDYVENGLQEDLAHFSIRAIGYDPWQATQMAGRLIEEGAPMVEVRPSVMNFSDPMKTLEGLVIAGKFHHNNDPVLTWMISNVVCHRDAKDNIYPRKEQPQNKIDGAVALLTALNRALNDDGTPKDSVYEERGLIFV